MEDSLMASREYDSISSVSSSMAGLYVDVKSAEICFSFGVWSYSSFFRNLM